MIFIERNVIEIYFSRTSCYAPHTINVKIPVISASIYIRSYRSTYFGQSTGRFGIYKKRAFLLYFTFFFFFLKRIGEKSWLAPHSVTVVTNFVFKLKRLSFALRLWYKSVGKERQESVNRNAKSKHGDGKMAVSPAWKMRASRYVMFFVYAKWQICTILQNYFIYNGGTVRLCACVKRVDVFQPWWKFDSIA